MLIALDHNDNKVHIEDTQSNQTYYCQCCGAPLITKKGDIRQHHFAHSANHRCSDTWEQERTFEMSPWHNEWQGMFPIDNQEVVLSLGSTKHRADVIVDRTVVEFQHSLMPAKRFYERNNFYFNLGYKVVWLFDLSDIYGKGDLRYEQTESGFVFNWRNPQKAFNSYDVKNGCIDLFFQITGTDSENSIVRVIDVSVNGFERFFSSDFISKEEFLSYVGLRDGMCAPPERYDLTNNEEYNKFCQKYNISLNKQQERAVQTINGSNLLLAVPGSGKTTVLVTRLGYMVINKGVDPNNILAVTYNKKAADEMRDRFNSKFGSDVGGKITFSTINALCYRIYCRYCDDHGIRKRIIIEDKKSREILVKVLTKYSKEYPSENDILALEQAISQIKNYMLSDDQLSEWNFFYPNIKEMYLDYQKALHDSGYMDFDDQMVFALAILKKEPNFLSKHNRVYKYISVDEAQDTSKIQHTIIKIIAQGNNLFMVGDEDQSIYGFRGAYPKALLNFRYNYTNPYIMRMERNYRSTEQIVKKAQRFISRNKGRYEKNMTAERGSGEDVWAISVRNREEQYSYLLYVARNHTSETAFLYRDNESSVILADMFLREKIPFVLKAPEMNFFGARVILDLVAYLKLAVNRYDCDSLKTVCNKGILYLKKPNLEYAIKDCRNKKCDVFEALEMQMRFLKKDQGRAGRFKEIMKKASELSPSEALDYILISGYRKHMEQNYNDPGKVELLKILAKKEKSIRAFLDRLKYLEEQICQGFNSKDPNQIILSTIHSSKGLEYDTVYMVDVYDGRFPSSAQNFFSRSKDNADGEQEERRLFYVGITRAKNKLNLFTIAQRASTFVEELFTETPEEREERLQKEHEELERKAAAEQKRRDEAAYNRNREEILKIIDKQQDEIVCDSSGNRWIKCEECGKVGLAREFPTYGGANHNNLGICKDCMNRR